MRRANSRLTLDVYAQTLSPAKRGAHRKLVELIQPAAEMASVPLSSRAPRRCPVTGQSSTFHLTSRKVKSSPSKATIVCAEPQLFVTDIKRSCEFFREKLGFSLVFSYGEPPYYAQVGRDAARLNLRRVAGPAIESAVRNREELLSVSMTVATAGEIKQLFLEFQSAGVTF